MPRSSPSAYALGIIVLVAIGGAVYLLSFANHFSKHQVDIERERNSSIPEQRVDAKIAALEHLWAQYPTHAPIALQLANLYADNAMHEKAVHYYRAALPLALPPIRHDVRVNLARELAALGRLFEAREEMRELLVDVPDHPAGLFNLGAIEANAGNPEEAEAAWNRLLVAHPEDSLAARARRNLYSLLNKSRGAD